MRSSLNIGLFIATLCCVILAPFHVKAATTLIPFGGQITSMTICPCSLNILLYVQDVRGYTLPLMYQPGVTLLYSWYRPTSGVWGLGNYVTGGTCLVYSGYTCTPGGYPVGTMSQLGTSMSIGN
ncbi:MAG: hypothetical protein V4576_02300 [Patescibacteria group bacterium]